MRYLLLNEIYIDTDNQLMIRAGETINLAPKVYDLLVFFCLNHHRVISKDELMDKVWAGTIVTENAISRTLVKVRKALGDDPKNPQFILTVPRKGYRMVAEFVACDQIHHSPQDEQSSDDDNIATSSTPHNAEQTYFLGKYRVLTIYAALFTTLLVFVAWLLMTKTDEPLQTKQLKPLTREVGDENFPAVSPDNSKLAYTKILTGKHSYINIENIKTHQKQSLSHPRGRLSKPKWATKENKLAFLYQHNHVCMIYWADINKIKDKNSWQAISECSESSSPNFVFSPDGQFLYFNDRASSTHGYQIFRVNLNTQEKDIVNQPITAGKGNYSFDISPDGQRLVMLNSEFEPVTRIYTLDVETSALTQTAQLSYLMRSVIWHHDSESIIHPSPHPAYELWQSELNGEKLAIVASNTSRVKHITRVNNGEDFTFVSYLLNRDIYFQTLAENSPSGDAITLALNNSSVMDYLPTLANKGDQYAFVSKRSTTAEVYLSQLSPDGVQFQTPVQLTAFNNHVKLYHLAYSPNDTQLLILADNQLYIANIETLSVEKIPVENMAINGVSWIDEQRLLFSTMKNSAWYIVSYDLKSHELTWLPSGYQAGLYSHADEHYYLIQDQSLQVMKLKTFDAMPEKTALTCQPGFRERKLTLMATQNGLVCQSPKAIDNEFLFFSFDDKKLSRLKISVDNFDFDINEQGIIYTQMVQSVADIMQTSSQ